MLTYETWKKEQEKPAFPSHSETKGALEVLTWAYQTYQDKVVYACSFGIEGIILIELISRIKPDAAIVFLDTQFHFRETYDTIVKVEQRYPSFHIHFQKPELSIEEQSKRYRKNLYEVDPDKCCELRKIIPLEQALAPSLAWISGLRREQSEGRKYTNYLNIDDRFQKIKICPLIHWTWDDVWQFVDKHQLDYNPLHDAGYPSIGCAPCTQPTCSMSDLRAGRWGGTGKTECGLHTAKLVKLN